MPVNPYTAPPRLKRQPAATLHLGPRGLALIKRFEGLRLKAYKAIPSEPYWTIGYGDYGPHVKPGQVITKAEAERRLKVRLQGFEVAVRRAGVPMLQREFDATVSFVYNLGPAVLDSDRTFGRLLRARKYWRAAGSMMLYVKAGNQTLPGLVRRRAAERKLFRRGLI